MALELEIFSEDEVLTVPEVIVPGFTTCTSSGSSTSSSCTCCAIAEY